MRWRWNLSRALVVLRQRGGRRNPPPIQRMEADDLMAAVFPALAACQENAAPGRIEIPDHPLVRQTLHDCLHEAMDVDGLVALLERDRDRRGARCTSRDTTEPSPLSHEILNGRPYTFLDDAPLEERRTRAVALRRGLPDSARELGRARPRRRSRACATRRAPEPRDADELHDALLVAGACCGRARTWQAWFDELVAPRRARRGSRVRTARCWRATERRHLVDALVPGAPVEPDVTLPDGARARGPRRTARPPRVAVVRGHLATRGPGDRAPSSPGAPRLPATSMHAALARLEAEGFALRGRFDPARGDDAASAARAACSRASTATPPTGCAARSSRSPRRTSCASCCAGSTWRPARSSRAGAACSR